MSSAFGAGQGADMLQEILRQKFTEAIQQQAMQQNAQRLQQEQQRLDMAAADRKVAMEDLARSRAIQNAGRIAGQLSPGQTVASATVEALKGGEMGDLVKHESADLPSRAISGIAQVGPKAPTMGPLKIVGAGRPERDTYLGTDAQLGAEQARQDRLAQIAQARQDKTDALAREQDFKREMAGQAQSGREDIAKLTASLRAPQLITVQTVDDNGKAVTKVVPKAAGATFAKAPGSTMEGRLASAEAVKQTGDDIVSKLGDPKFQAAVGPVMGRYSSLREFIGNPPPEYAELAGQIESFALANMGVHGMRSAQGAEQIKKLLDQRHTPQSLIATVNGLNAFSQHFLENNRMGTAAAADTGKKPAAAETPEQRIKRLLGGG